MRIPDTNLLLFAYNKDSQFHPPARDWLSEALSSAERVGFSWTALLGFIRIGTSSVFPSPLSLKKALDLVDVWLAQPVATVIEPTDRHPTLLRELLEKAGTAGNLTTDAHLAALAIEHGATIATFDTDFHRFSGLKLEYLGRT